MPPKSARPARVTKAKTRSPKTEIAEVDPQELVAQFGITMLQAMFALHYVTGGYNGIKAAKEAGYKGAYSVLGSTAHDNLKNPKIKECIHFLMRTRVVAEEEVLARLSTIVRGFDPTDYMDIIEVFNVDRKGNQYPAGLVAKFDLAKLRKDGYSHLIKRVRQTKIGVDIEWHDPLDGLQLMGRHYKLFTDRTELEGKLDLTDSGLTDADRAARIAAILDKARQRKEGGSD